MIVSSINKARSIKISITFRNAKIVKEPELLTFGCIAVQTFDTFIEVL